MSKPPRQQQHALSKLLFCMRHAATPASFLRLLVNTKKLHRSKRYEITNGDAEKPVSYRLKFKGKYFTFWLRTLSGDLHIFYEIFWQRVYAIPAIDWAVCKTIVDLGGNIGMSAIFFWLQAPQAHLLVIEPDEENLSLLRQNTSVLSNKIALIHAAAAAQSGKLYLQQSRYAYNSSTTTASTGLQVAAISMNDLIKQCELSAIDFLKIDIEGGEEGLFSDSAEWLSIVKRIVIEIHSAKAFAVCAKALDTHRFKVYCLSGVYGDAGIYYAFQ